MSFVAAAIGIGGLASAGAAVYGANAAQKAAGIQAQAAQNALDYQRGVTKPYLDIGQGATYKLSQLTGTGANSTPDFSQFYTSPDYQFRQQQGELAIERGANARGLNLSGGTLKDLASFNSGLASQEYGNYFNRLMGLSQMGANAATSSGQMVGNTMQGLGQAQASGVVGSANAYMGAANNFTNSALGAAALLRPSSYGNNTLGDKTFGGGGNPFNVTGSRY